jgi:hypothetical protein
MKIVAVGHDLVITEAFSGVLFETDEGQKMSVCMRDGGFDVRLYAANGQVTEIEVRDGVANVVGGQSAPPSEDSDPRIQSTTWQ